MPIDLVLRGARTWAGADLDIAVDAGRVARLLPVGTPVDARAEVGVGGRTVIPGLWDHHVHFDQWAQLAGRLDLGGAEDPGRVLRIVARHLARGARPDVVIGYGFRGAPWLDTVRAADLDRVTGPVPVILIGADLHAAWLNTAALERHGLSGNPTGVLREGEWFDLWQRLGDVDTPTADALAEAAARRAAARGVVGVVDFEKGWTVGTWTRRIGAGNRLLRVVAGIWPEDLPTARGLGLRTGAVLPGTDALAVVGPLKIIADGSLNTCTAYCRAPYPGTGDHGVMSVPRERLVDLLGQARRAGLAAAVHAIGDAALGQVLDAFEATGARGSIEHAQLTDAALVARTARAGLVASIQPEHAMDDRDTAERLWPGRAGAFAWADLARAGVPLALGSDAPVCPLDPWQAISAAVHRSRGGRPAWHPEQALSLTHALAASTARPTPAHRAADRLDLHIGDVADLAVLDADPRSLDADALRVTPVAATLLAGRWTHCTL